MFWERRFTSSYGILALNTLRWCFGSSKLLEIIIILLLFLPLQCLSLATLYLGNAICSHQLAQPRCRVPFQRCPHCREPAQHHPGQHHLAQHHCVNHHNEHKFSVSGHWCLKVQWNPSQFIEIVSNASKWSCDPNQKQSQVPRPCVMLNPKNWRQWRLVGLRSKLMIDDDTLFWDQACGPF